MRSFGSNGYGTRKSVTPWIILGVTVGIALLATIIVGNLLKVWLDEEALKELSNGNTDPPPEVLYDAPVQDVMAYSFVFGNSTSRLPDAAAVSVSLNTPAGETTYVSDVATYFGITPYRSADLYDSLESLREASITYISGVFYPQAFKAASADLRYATMQAECALLREFLQTGGSEILLCDLPLDSTGTVSILEYVTAVKRAAGTSPVGVAIPWSVATQADAHTLLGKLLNVCDFLALDMRDESIPLSECTFYLTQYDMRLLYCTSQTEQIAIAEPTVTNLQTVTKPPVVLPPEDTEDTER